MTSERLEEMFKGVSAERAPENFRSCRWGDERTVKRAQTGSEDPHRQQNILTYFHVSMQVMFILSENQSVQLVP